jgi:beta-lactamase class D
MRKTNIPFALLSIPLLCLGACSAGPSGDPLTEADSVWEVNLSHLFEGGEPVEATFVLVNGMTGETVRHNPIRAAERFVPASTFKIPNSLIALETGVATGPDFTIPYDSLRMRRDGFWAAEWSRDHTLRSAFQNSVYWYYQEIARRVGEPRMIEYLARFDYGNQDIGGGLDRFWLEGDLRISPNEQVRFLQDLHEGRLGVSDRSTALLKEIMVLETSPAYTLSGKTGTADVTPTRELAWLVGYVEREDLVWYYALNMEGEEVWERWGQPAARRALVLAILRELGVVPAEGLD